jgi:hypothetical protein
MARLSLLLFASALLLACSSPHLFSQPITSEKTMLSTTGIAIKPITLTAREERRLPAGLKPTNDRDRAFATVFIEFENTSPNRTKIVQIQQVQVRKPFDLRSQLSLPQPLTMTLQPLEVSAQSIHLHDRALFHGWGDRVQAVVTYQIDGKTFTATSEAVAIEQH